VAAAGLAPAPKFQLYEAAPEAPADAFVKVTVDPAQTVSGAPVKSASRPQPRSVMARVTVVPAHPAALVSVTVTLPLVVPKVTVMLFVPDPAVIIEPAGTVQA